MRDLAFSGLLRELGIAAVPHGLRSSFRDWAAERTDAPHAVMEATLARVVRNQVEAATFEDKMAHWAEAIQRHIVEGIAL
ncbi:MAG: hypothetical protein OXH85_03350 [Truepera sp.]|nr:hypothetical protein [Truepera sp.]